MNSYTTEAKAVVVYQAVDSYPLSYYHVILCFSVIKILG